MVLVRSSITRDELVNVAALPKIGIQPSTVLSLAQNPHFEIDLYTSDGSLYITKEAAASVKAFVKGTK